MSRRAGAGPATSLTTPGLGAVTIVQLQAAVDRFGLGQLLTAEPASTGNFGQNVFLSSESGPYVFRGNPYVEGQLAREQHFAGVFHDRCPVPAPWPYLYEPSTRLFGWPYAIMGRVGGEQIADPERYDAMTPDERRELAAGLGRAAARISSVEVDQLGHWDPASGTVIAPRPNWASWVRRTVLDQVDRSLGVSAAERTWLISLLDAASARLSAPFQPVLVHGDFSRHNVTATRRTGVWEVAGVYDLASSHYGHPDVQLTRQFADFLDHTADVARSFLDAGLAEVDDFDPVRFRALLVLERIGIWEWAKRERRGWWPAELSFRDWLEQYLHAVPD